MASYPTLDFQRIVENLVFIAEVFVDREDDEIPNLPFLELVRSFDLKRFGLNESTSRKGHGPACA
jgi:hypothetical protein